MAELNLDIFEQILVRMNVRDLIRCKGVCKSWKSLISENRFIETQLNYSINTYRNNNGIGHRRVTISLLPDGFTSFKGAVFCNLLGSSNGLVCIYASNSQILVANPCTREVKMVTQIRDFGTRYGSICYGFGYDESIEDYKVVVGVRKGVGRTCFQVLYLKSNVWKVAGEVENTYVSGVGILCNGALHWVMNHGSPIIVSFDLSQEVVKAIPQPDDVLYRSIRKLGPDMSLGIIEECLCIYHNALIAHKIWMMKKYNVKESWGIVEGSHECELNREILRFFRQLKNGIPFERSKDCNILFFRTREFISAPIFVQSLVSPLFAQEVINGDSSVS